MPSQTLLFKQRILIRDRVTDLCTRLVRNAIANQMGDENPVDLLDRALLGAAYDHCRALWGDPRTEGVLLRGDRVSFTARLRPAFEAPLLQFTVHTSRATGSLLSSCLNRSRSIHRSTPALDDPDSRRDVAKVRQVLRQALRAQIEARLVTRCAEHVIENCSTTAALDRYMPSLMSLAMANPDDYRAKALAERREKSYGARGQRNDAVEPWVKAIGLAEGIIARASLLTDDKDAMPLISADMDLVLPDIRLVPDWLKMPPYEEPFVG